MPRDDGFDRGVGRIIRDGQCKVDEKDRSQGNPISTRIAIP